MDIIKQPLTSMGHDQQQSSEEAASLTPGTRGQNGCRYRWRYILRDRAANGEEAAVERYNHHMVKHREKRRQRAIKKRA